MPTTAVRWLAVDLMLMLCSTVNCMIDFALSGHATAWLRRSHIQQWLRRDRRWHPSRTVYNDSERTRDLARLAHWLRSSTHRFRHAHAKESLVLYTSPPLWQKILDDCVLMTTRFASERFNPPPRPPVAVISRTFLSSLSPSLSSLISDVHGFLSTTVQSAVTAMHHAADVASMHTRQPRRVSRYSRWPIGDEMTAWILNNMRFLLVSEMPNVDEGGLWSAGVRYHFSDTSWLSEGFLFACLCSMYCTVM